MQVRKHFTPEMSHVKVGQADLDKALAAFYTQQAYYDQQLKPLLQQGKPVSKVMRQHLRSLQEQALTLAEALLESKLVYSKKLRGVINHELAWRVDKLRQVMHAQQPRRIGPSRKLMNLIGRAQHVTIIIINKDEEEE